MLANRLPNSAAKILCDRYQTQDIEIALTKLDADIGLSQNGSNQTNDWLRTLRQSIESELADYFTHFQVTENCIAEQQWLHDLVNGAFSAGDVAVSLNYDCVLEGALDCCKKWTPNGGYGSSIDNTWMLNIKPSKSPVTVLKIHGSANFVIAPYADNPTASAVNFIFNEHFFPLSAKHTHIGFGAGTGKSYVIAPSYVKIPSVEIAYLMLDALAASTNAKNLIIMGCALRPEDGFLTLLITNFMRLSSWRDRKIIIVDQDAESIKNRLKDYWGVDVSNQILPIQGQLQVSIARLLEVIGD